MQQVNGQIRAIPAIKTAIIVGAINATLHAHTISHIEPIALQIVPTKKTTKRKKRATVGNAQTASKRAFGIATTYVIPADKAAPIVPSPIVRDIAPASTEALTSERIKRTIVSKSRLIIMAVNMISYVPSYL